MSTSAAPNPLAKNPASEGNLWVKVTIPIYVLTVAVVAVRVWWRRRLSGRIAPTDICILISLVSSLSN